MNKKGLQLFLLLWTACLISSIGSGLSSFGLGVYVFKVSGLSGATGAVMLAGFLPGLLLSPLAGVLADRYDRRLLMLLGDGLSALGILFILISFSIGNDGLFPVVVGVTVSSVFSSLVEPAFRASVSDLLTKEDFTRASGLSQLAGSARYLISPVLAGILLSRYDIRLLLLLDIGTIVLMVSLTGLVRRRLQSEGKSFSHTYKKTSLCSEMKEGFFLLMKNKGLKHLIFTSACISFSLGSLQTLLPPMVLSFESEKFLEAATTLSATGLLFGSFLLGIFPVKKGFLTLLFLSLSGAGLFTAGLSLRENRVLICLTGFLFFFMLPFANASFDYLARTNLPEETEGRAWGMISILSQLGYAVAFAFSGAVADRLFVPFLKTKHPITRVLHRLMGAGSGRSFALFILLSGILLLIIAFAVRTDKHIKRLEAGHDEQAHYQ